MYECMNVYVCTRVYGEVKSGPSAPLRAYALTGALGNALPGLPTSPKRVVLATQ